MAQILICPEGSPCGTCRHCSLVQRRIHPDLRVLQLPPDRKTIPIRDVHDFIQGIALKPLEAERKVYVVDSADLLSEDGANAFLKTLEEPPPAVTLILTATDPARLLPTVVSRCQRIPLRPVPVREIEAYLVEHGAIAAGPAAELAEESHGLPGLAFLAMEDPERIAQQRQHQADLRDLLGSSRLDRIRYADSLAERWSAHADQVASVLETWIEAWRTIVRDQIRGRPSTSESAALDPALTLEPDRAREALGSTLDALEDLRGNAHPRLTLELLLLRWPRLQGASTQ
jgi:DNA polymerase-3 subunit delta'